jgi:hypothetical protein
MKKEYSKETLEIAERVQREINHLCQNRKEDDVKWKNEFQNIIYEIDTEIFNAKNLIKEDEELSFTVNRIEAEGFLRGLTFVHSILKQRENWLTDEEV